jgi:D-alanine-D-alanine ligase
MAPRVAVLMGGLSAEREVSLVTGRECAQALREAGYGCDRGRCGPDLAERLTLIKPDVCFNALHGRWGEDGCVQGLLEWLRIPYTHSGISPRPLRWTRRSAKEVYPRRAARGAESVLATREAVEAGHVLPPPYVVKPNNEGSSVGVYIVREGSNAPRLSASMPARVMVETYAPGRELTTR